MWHQEHLFLTEEITLAWLELLIVGEFTLSGGKHHEKHAQNFSPFEAWFFFGTSWNFQAFFVIVFSVATYTQCTY